ncbi:hypothetical protein ETA_07040 [Erwinia tasmaniensis Et1/99]|uniref:Uncharacterized protein n=1 Tax=Erwinia tasmaniensis (strain DSM 17950 / CFBP 7177 / CIP 109463 / NCPPB 4357 / Et1/99) TaxID=465817 RepID=B2VGR8_ERWT9|nr:hypothetical protein ETA_07040 [Erwinia tasmaniensis Et1/99]
MTLPRQIEASSVGGRRGMPDNSPRMMIATRHGVSSRLFCQKVKNFFTRPLDAVLPGPILSGIQEYEPGKKT